MIIRYIPCFVTAIALIFSAREVYAENLPQYPIEYTISEADNVVLASLVEGDTVQIKEVFSGSLLVGQKVQISLLMHLSRTPFENSRDAFASIGRSDEARQAMRNGVILPLPETPKDVNGDLFLFLTRSKKPAAKDHTYSTKLLEDYRLFPVEKKSAGLTSGFKWLEDGSFSWRDTKAPAKLEFIWTPAGGGSGVKWLNNGKVYGYQQLENPGGYWLLPDEEAQSESAMKEIIGQAIAKKSNLKTTLVK